MSNNLKDFWHEMQTKAMLERIEREKRGEPEPPLSVFAIIVSVIVVLVIIALIVGLILMPPGQFVLFFVVTVCVIGAIKGLTR